MSQTHDILSFQEIFDAQGQPLGAILGPEAWASVREIVLQHFSLPEAEPEKPEPLEDWRSLVLHWDFRYPVDLDVSCPFCGSDTADWEHDSPRKFMLTAANMGGLVSFRCLSCQARIIKRHFYDAIKVEALPYSPEKGLRNKGRAS
ncbi:MAG: hypothetical protein Q7I92_15880 [Humidesulfovibrio sp.]|jgi:hypothetical protein|nr:hypothetical protein [Humidesulfovibrio sp.]PKN08686.1 MAG: hypothetical protein CVU73_05420 [Deltaproteobacteria bacterium HGW-Deltaproteobacteria-8]